MITPLVSVIVPTYNRIDKCKRAVESVINQTFKDFEIIVVDDCSTDGTCAKYLYGSRIGQTYRYYRNSINSGISKARNTGISLSRGKWISFLDSDDEWLPDKLEKQIQWTYENPQYHIVQTREIWIRNGVRVNPPRSHEKKAGDIFGESLKRCMITPSSVMIKKSLLEHVGFFNESLPVCEDYDLWLRISHRYPVGLVDEYLLKRYGGHKDQLSSSIAVLDKYRIRALLQLLTYEHLTTAQKILTKSILVKKAAIVAKGLEKIDRIPEYERYRKIADKYKC
mgnify:FL=1